MANIDHLLRDLRFTEYEAVNAFMKEIAEADVPEHLVQALIYRQGFVTGRKDERRRQEEKREQTRLYHEKRRAELAAQQAETIEEVIING